MFCHNNTSGLISPSDAAQHIASLLQMSSLSPVQRNAIEYRTKGQGRSECWRSHRQHRITASVFNFVVKRQQPPDALAERMVANVGPPSSLLALVWGRQHEATAQKVYVAHIATQGKSVTVKSSGLHIMHNGFLGATPGGIVYDSTLDLQRVPEINTLILRGT